MATSVIEDDEELASRFGDEPEEDDEPEDEDEPQAESTDAFSAYEAKIRATVAKRVKAYREKMQAKLDERVAAFTTRVEDGITAKLDQWTLAHGAASSVQNPEAVAANLARMASAAESRLNQIREQLAALEAAGVDVSQFSSLGQS